MLEERNASRYDLSAHANFDPDVFCAIGLPSQEL